MNNKTALIQVIPNETEPDIYISSFAKHLDTVIEEELEMNTHRPEPTVIKTWHSATLNAFFILWITNERIGEPYHLEKKAWNHKEKTLTYTAKTPKGVEHTIIIDMTGLAKHLDWKIG